ncbi:histone deacetylase family protein [Melittangium boletus]|uniref:Histone deacetylase n=1 Tax=Melittangium boletus DSM 14713 TaxID=1294270 RepID=A0A250IAA4_9BACT|nr:histone deacetylase [Melittangium boletus]ATB28153.1 histone deacetylase [Melittangium boletus DSM 14713]
MTQTLLLTDPLFLQHDPGPQHPECPARLKRILELLERHPIPGTERRVPRPATEEELAAVHTPRLRAYLKSLQGRSVEIDEDTVTSPASYDAALLAAGGSIQAVEEVLAGRARNAFAMGRPPGHHAEPDQAMGFCLFNNAAIAAEAARRQGAQRVLIFDWDVHHGNGTQSAFWKRPDVLYMSAHQFPYYPHSGAPDEIGEGEGTGYTVNCGIPGGGTDADYAALCEQLFLPVARDYRPDLVIISAGFDAHREDPIGGMVLTERGFAAMCTAFKDLAQDVCGGRLVMLLEGGYSLEGLSRSAYACIEVLAERTRERFPTTGASRDTAAALRISRTALAPHWPVLGR